MDQIREAAEAIKKSSYTVGFTGAGISVESGIPPFRGEGGLWNKYDPTFIEISYFYNNPLESWKMIKKVFYDFMGSSSPNKAHKGFYFLEDKYNLKSIITQNIDGLHQQAGNRDILEYHGTIDRLVCTKCTTDVKPEDKYLSTLPVACPSCGSLMKPDFVFFGEAIPEEAARRSAEEIRKCDTLIVVGTTGEVMPACQLPYAAKQLGATIIEINPDKSAYTNQITDIFIPLKAGEAFSKLIELL
jgi:NAD-dependent deacetylase